MEQVIMSLKSNLLQYQKEQNEILEDIVFNSIYPQMKEKPDGNRLGLEFFITSSCNKKCTYCYLHKNEDKLYPKEIRDPEIIISNLKILLDHFSKYNEGKYETIYNKEICCYIALFGSFYLLRYRCRRYEIWCKRS